MTNRVTLPPHITAISRAKAVAQQWMKYLGGYLEGCPTIFDERVPTMGVDAAGRLYVNPQWCLQWSDEQNAYVLLHEMCHNLLAHADRRQTYLPNANDQQLHIWNVAADLCIQQVLEDWDQYRPKPSEEVANYANIPGMVEGLSTERYYGILWNNGQPPVPPPPPPKGPGDEEKDGGPGGYPGPQSDKDGDEDGDGNGGKSKPGDTESNGDGDGETQQSDKGGSGGRGKSKQPHGRSGSASDGVKQDYELDADLTSTAANLARLEEVRQQMEDDGSIGQGTGMGKLKQSLNVRLRRQPDPFDQLKAIVGKETSSPVGVDEYTYRRPGRLQQHDDYPTRGVIRVNPECVVVLDTSGSMGCGAAGERVSRALTAIAHGVRRLRNPRVISWDGGLRDDKRCESLRDFQWIGGGGTDMATAVTFADQKYKPDCIVLVTDCGTHWPDKPTRARLVVAAVAMDSKPPKWARVVDLTKEAPGYVG